MHYRVPRYFGPNFLSKKTLQNVSLHSEQQVALGIQKIFGGQAKVLSLYIYVSVILYEYKLGKKTQPLKKKQVALFPRR